MRKKTTIAILISNILSGGTLRHAQDLTQAWIQQGHRVLVIFLIRHLTKIIIYEQNQSPKIVLLYDDDELNQTADILRMYRTSILHVEHMMGCPKSLIHLNIKAECHLAVTLHDYYTICPFIQLVNKEKMYCGEEGCKSCLQKRKLFSPTFDKIVDDIFEWRSFWYKYLRSADTVMVPSEDMLVRMKKYFPDVPIRFVENPEMVPYRSTILTVGIIGAISTVKGAKKIKETISYCVQNKINIHFVLFGTLQDEVLTEDESRYIDVLGPYQENEIYQKIRSYSIDFFWFPGVLPETYSYTLSIPIRLRIPCLSTDIGAISSRILTNHWGRVYPWQADVATIVDTLLNFDYESFHNPNFYIRNDSLPDIETFYDKYLNLQEELNNVSYNEIQSKYSLDKALSNIKNKVSLIELHELWNHVSYFRKIQLLCHVNYMYYLHKFTSEGLFTYFKKIMKKTSK